MAKITKLTSALAICLVLVASASPARADRFRLANGAMIEGQWLNRAASPPAQYEIQLDNGAKLILPAASVHEVHPDSDALRSYKAMAERPDTAESHWSIAQKCREVGLSDEARAHMQRAIELEPDHEGARFGLGYRRVEGQWRLMDAWKRDQGLVLYQGDWVFPQDAFLEQSRQAREEQFRAWRDKIRLWRTWILKGRGKDVDGIRELEAIQDPLAAEVLAGLLTDGDRKEPDALKLLYANVLGRLATPPAISALAKTAILDRSEQIRSRCLDLIEQSGKAEQAAPLFISALKQSDITVINQAAGALARLKRTEAVPFLIDVLVVQRTVQVGGGGAGINPSFDSNGGGGLSMGGKPKLEKVNVKNPTVRDALAVLTGANQFDYNQELWKRWYIQMNTPRAVELRRNVN